MHTLRRWSGTEKEIIGYKNGEIVSGASMTELKSTAGSGSLCLGF